MKTIRIPALEITQGQRTLYSFAIDGKQIHSFATVSRMKRDEQAQLGGYQRPEVLSHINSIRNYIESSSPLIPNAVVLAFDERVTFERIHESGLEYLSYGTLIIPMDEASDEKKPGFIVDGQQRLAAVREAEVASFPICVTAFIASDVAQQTEQFLLVNSTKPLSKSLIYELLPEASAALPTRLQKKRLPSHLLTRLNYEAGSPLLGKVKTTTNPAGVIKDTGLLASIEASLSDGALYRMGDDAEAMMALLHRYWGAISHVFKTSWKLPPKKTRLWHGASVISLGLLMDTICSRKENPTAEEFVEELQHIAPLCRWTEGRWEFELDSRKWDDIQNTPKDIALLSGYLSRQYRKAWEGR